MTHMDFRGYGTTMAKERGEEGETIEAAAFSLEIGFLADAYT